MTYELQSNWEVVIGKRLFWTMNFLDGGRNPSTRTVSSQKRTLTILLLDVVPWALGGSNWSLDLGNPATLSNLPGPQPSHFSHCTWTGQLGAPRHPLCGQEKLPAFLQWGWHNGEPLSSVSQKIFPRALEIMMLLELKSKILRLIMAGKSPHLKVILLGAGWSWKEFSNE